MALRAEKGRERGLPGQWPAVVPRDNVDRFVRAGIAIAAVSFAVIAICQFAFVFVFDGETVFLNADAEDSSFSWASSVVTFSAGVVAFLIALDGHLPRRYFALAALLAWFSFDDSVQMHERIGEWVTEDVFLAREAYSHAVWVVVFLPLLAAAFLLLWRVGEELPARARTVLRAGLACLVVGLVAEAAAAAWYGAGETAETFFGATQIAVEEGAELAGWILIATGLSVALRAAFSRI